MIRTTVDSLLESIRSIGLSMDEQAELIQRLRDGEGEEHKPLGQWVASRPPAAPVDVRFNAEQPGFNVDWIHGPDVSADNGIVVTFYHGQMDGKPVIQIDGSADFRINVNDCPVWDQSTEVDYSIPKELQEELDIRKGVLASASPPQKQEVWVGTIKDGYGSWIFVGATREALYHYMRSNYGEVEYRDESNYDWSKRVNDVATLTVDSYYVETEEPDEQ